MNKPFGIKPTSLNPQNTNVGVVISLKEVQCKILKMRFGFGCSTSEMANQLRLKLRSIEKLMELTLRKEFIKDIV
jgi:hypothetical protein